MQPLGGMAARAIISPSVASLATSYRKPVAGAAATGIDERHEKRKWYGGCIVGFLGGIVIGAQIFGADLRLASNESISSIHARSSSLNNASTTRDGFQLASKQSFGFFDDIPDQEWETFYRTPALYGESHQHRFKNSLKDSKNPPIFLMNNYEPVFTCPYKKRVGGVGDGPKW
jgi:Methyltransferase domain